MSGMSQMWVPYAKNFEVKPCPCSRVYINRENFPPPNPKDREWDPEALAVFCPACLRETILSI